ncbi:MAG: urea transporter [Polyangiales bacterium]
MALSAAASARAAPHPLGAFAELGDIALRSAASLLFSRERAVGAALLAAAATAPRALAAGLFAVGVSVATARALRLPPEQIRSGQLSYNALMVGLAMAALAPATWASLALLTLAAAASVLAASALDLALRVGHGLPVLTLPFLVTFYLAMGTFPPGAAHPAAPVDALAGAIPEGVLAGWLRALGAILCAPRLDAGALVLVALALHSRVALALSLAGFALAFTLCRALVGDVCAPWLAATAGLNGMLVAVALATAWFIPSAWSYLLGLGAAALSVVVGAGLAARFERLGLPLLIVPFNLTVPLVLYVMRQRVADGRPHAIDFEPGTPEQNLAYFRARRERFGSLAGLRFHAPFRGAWTCTQGVDGGVTHQGPWRHALDFEALREGRAFRGEGATLDDFYGYKLPVLAPAAGVVARVIDGVADNPVGEVNLDDNWGNAVIVYHAPGVYSCLAHLAPGSITVVEGQAVAAGEVLGSCGNSGRSATPHLHLQLQATAALGDATLPIALHDVVALTDCSARLYASRTPLEGEVVRRLDRDDELAAPLRFEHGAVTLAQIDGAPAEALVADIDPLGRPRIRSARCDATLYYETSSTGFTVLDVTGAPSSALHLLRAALSRVPFDGDDCLTWRDRLPLRPFLPAWRRPLYDLSSPFGGEATLAMTYRARRLGSSVVVEGVSDRRDRDGAPWLETSAALSPRGGLGRVTVTLRGRARRVVLAPEAPRSLLDTDTAPNGGMHERARA